MEGLGLEILRPETYKNTTRLNFKSSESHLTG